MEKLKLTVALIPLAGALGGFYYYSDESLLLRVVALLVAAGLSILIAMQSETGRAAVAFVQDSRTEVRKVVWPTRKETWQTTVFVLVAVLFVGVCLWLMDMFLGWAVRYFTV